MNDRLDELVSAYFDDELAARERAEVDERLETSSEVQRELKEIQSLSGLLKDLPPPTLSEDFRAQVMQAAERATLLASNEPKLAMRVSASRSVRWVATAIASVVVIAVIALAVNVPGLRNPVNTAGRDARTAMPLLTNETDSVAATREAVTDGVTVAAKSATHTTESEISRAPVAFDAQLLFNSGQLSKANVGEVVEALDTSGAQMAVVKLFVVDRHKSLESLRLLLSRNQILPDPESDSSAAKTESIEQTADQLMAVYVETNKQQLTAALEQLNQNQEFQSLQLASPVQFASLKPDFSDQIRFSKGRVDKPAASLQRVATPATPATVASRTSAFKKEDSKQELPIADSLQESRARPSLASTEPQTRFRSRQLPVRLSSDFFRSVAPGKLLGQSNSRIDSVKVDAAETDASRRGGMAGGFQNQPQQSVHVLFFLVSQEDGNESAPTPAESSSNGEKAKALRKAREEGAA